ncbi:RNA 2',3'-cyclic phosphodiesterase [bacterium]|nr:RNA 2',3'-cyclic phosphodiesterase [bacterium]
MRLFIAIPLTPEIKKALANQEERLKPSILGAKWVEPCGIHLTLKFLGETDEERVKDIAECCQKAAEGKPSFIISLGCVGGFPNLVIPRVIWVGIDQGKERVSEIAKDLEEKLHKIGFPKETRPFHPHLTLARIKMPKRVLFPDIEPCSERMRVSSIQLIQSTLTPKGSIYKAIEDIGLW